MKIALVGPYPKPGQKLGGGVEAVMSCHADTFSRFGHNVHVININGAEPGERSERTEPSGLVVHELGRWRRFSAFEGQISLKHRIGAVLARIGPQVCHVHGEANWAPAQFQEHTVLTLHGCSEIEVRIRRPFVGALVAPAIRFVQERAYSRIRNIHLINPYAASLRQRNHSQQFTFIPNPTARIFFDYPKQRPARTSHAMALCWVGNASKRKNLPLALEILQNLLDLGLTVRLRVVGVDRDQVCCLSDHVSLLAQRLESRDAIEYLGRRLGSEVAAVMDASTALLLTSVQETAPCVVSEALARGLPVFAPNAFGLPYMVTDPALGLLFEKGANARESANLIAVWLASGNVSKWDARYEAATEYHPDRIGQRMLEYYDRVVSGG